jgi:hypothetical protein
LLRLPRELRDEIYNYALTGHIISFECKVARKVASQESSKHWPVRHLLTLTTTCRQTHAECAHLIFSDNTFITNDTYAEEAEFKNYILEIHLGKLEEHQRNLISSVRLQYCHFECHSRFSISAILAKLPGLKEVIVCATWLELSRGQNPELGCITDAMSESVGRPVHVVLEESRLGVDLEGHELELHVRDDGWSR